MRAGDSRAALTLGLRTYGPELLGFLHGLAPSGVQADELFSELCERIWMGLSGFRGECSFRAWAYRVARNLVTDTYRRQRLPIRRCLDIDEISAIHRIVDEARTTTAIHLRDDTKSRLREIRASLGPDDRTLLILRVDRQLTWREVAHVLDDGASDVERTARRLRKRFERIKETLRAQLVAG